MKTLKANLKPEAKHWLLNQNQINLILTNTNSVIGLNFSSFDFKMLTKRDFLISNERGVKDIEKTL